jgi:hypothetical protein
LFQVVLLIVSRADLFGAEVIDDNHVVREGGGGTTGRPRKKEQFISRWTQDVADLKHHK